MAAYEVLLLNTAVPQIQAAQSGDTYVVPRDIAFSAALTLSAGTANGVPYLNGSKVLTTGSALVFDGSNFFGGTNTYVTGRFYAQRSSSSLNLPIAGYTDGSAGAVLTGAKGDIVAFGNAGGDGVIFANANTEAMRLDSTGLGIGTSSPGEKLEVSASNAMVKINASGSFAQLGYYNSGSLLWNAYADIASGEYRLGNSGGTRLTLTSSGNLGLSVTPSPWVEGTGLNVGSGRGGSIYTETVNYGFTTFNANAYYSATNTWKYVTSNAASRYQQLNGVHSWYSAASGTAGNAITFNQRMTLTEAGRLGIGQTSPGVALSVAGASETWQLALATNNTTSGAVIGSPAADVIAFGNWAGTERARITSGGYFKASNDGTYNDAAGAYHELKGTQDGGRTVIITASSATNPVGVRINYSGATPNGTGNQFVYCDDSTALRAEIRSNGGLANYQSNDVDLSDIRTKTDINPVSSYWSKIAALEIVSYKYKDQTHDDLNIGVIAQQVEQVAPEFVDVDGFGETPEDGVPLKTIYNKDLTFAAIKALQEAMARIETLEAEVAALKGN